MSSGGDYQVSWTLQQNAASDVSKATSGLDASLSDVNAQVNKLMATWDSDAQQAYGTRQGQWTTASDNIKSALQQFQASLTSAAETSQGVESRNTNLVSGA
ncbi:WXG100 family type VII secretion target [Geodermatophilaceae bacterium NBWT11]|jgi:early secretory antigenic target protein ESAT-6|nr:WXG100 family type VII secretion target [Geodermatophilaceae bacterium NBWT11]